MPPDLDALLTALYVLADDFLPKRWGPGRRPRISDAEIVCLAVAQIFLDCPKERRFLRFASVRLGHLFPYIPGQSGYNKRVRALAPQIAQLVSHLAWLSPSFCDRLRLLDSTPVPCAQSRETVKRSQLAGSASYGYCASHSRYFWGLRLHLLCTVHGLPLGWALTGAKADERDVLIEILSTTSTLVSNTRKSATIIGDKNYYGRAFEATLADQGITLLRPARKGETPSPGHRFFKPLRQIIESVNDTLKGQLDLEHHQGRTIAGVCTRIGQRILALTAAIWHNDRIGHTIRRSLTPYDH